MSSERTPAEPEVPEGAEVCWRCCELYGVLTDKSVAAEIQDSVDVALRREPPRRALLVTDPSSMSAAALRQRWKVNVAKERRYWIEESSDDELREVARARLSHEGSAEVLRKLDVPLRGPEVRVLFVWRRCVTYVTGLALARGNLSGPEPQNWLGAAALGRLLLAPKKPLAKLSTDVLPAGAKRCETCQELYFVMHSKPVAIDLQDAVDGAMLREPRRRALLVTDHSCRPTAAPQDSWQDTRARDGGLNTYYIKESSDDELRQVARAHPSHEDSDEVLRKLDIPLRGWGVRVLFVWKGCLAYTTGLAMVDSTLRVPDPLNGLSAVALGPLLLRPKKPKVQKSPQPNPADVEPKNPVVETSPQHGPGRAVPAPSQAARPAVATPAVRRPPSKLETLGLDPRLVRMVLRVSPELQEDLTSISERLFDETRLEYSYAAIIRGLISLGLAAIAGKANLAVEFAGARVSRGRKRGSRWKARDHEDE